MADRWKPEVGEQYFYIYPAGDICYMLNNNEELNRDHVKYGNCFKTREEAEYAARKVKVLLLQLATNLQDKPLPKLTAEVFDRADCPEWAKYAVVNMHGTGFFYENEPSYGTENYKGLWYVDTGRTRVMQDIIFDSTDWQNSLVERPAKLPDWCKVGEWVYITAFNTYFKVDKVDGSFIDGTDFCGSDFSIAIEDVRQARLRPYNADEMKALVGKSITLSDGAVYLCTAWLAQDNVIVLGSTLWNSEDLIKDGYTIDGKPCGRLEHLENGEWVQ